MRKKGGGGGGGRVNRGLVVITIFLLTCGRTDRRTDRQTWTDGWTDGWTGNYSSMLQMEHLFNRHSNPNNACYK